MVLLAYVTGTVVDKPPTAVTAAVVPHGVIATPVYGVVVTEHVNVTDTDAFTMEKYTVDDEAAWLASPAYEYDADAVFVPALMLFAYVGVPVMVVRPAPVTLTEHGTNAAPVYAGLVHVIVVTVGA